MTVRVTLLSPAASTATAAACFEDGHPLTKAGRARARRAAGAVAALAARTPRTAEGAHAGAGADAGADAASEPGPAAWAGSAAGPEPMRVPVSGTVRCAQTARALGLRPGAVPALGGWAMGAWRGWTLAGLTEADPEAVAAWLADPWFTPPGGGECLVDLCARVRAWLAGLGADRPPAAEAAAGPAAGATAGHGRSFGGRSGRVLAVVEPDVVRAAVLAALDAPYGMFWRLDVRPLTATVLSGRAGRWNVRIGTELGGPSECATGPADAE